MRSLSPGARRSFCPRRRGRCDWATEFDRGPDRLNPSTVMIARRHREHRASTWRVWLAGALLILSGLFVWFYATSWGCRIGPIRVASMVRTAVAEARARGVSPCPTFEEVVHAGILDPEFAQTLDGRSLEIRCHPLQTVVVWAGPDRRFATLDDQTVPDPLEDPPPQTISRIGLPAIVSVALGSWLLTAIAVLKALFAWPRAALFAGLASCVGRERR